MKKVIFLFPVFFYVISCNDAATPGKDSKDSTVKAATSDTGSMNYPYTIKDPDSWVPGDKKNTLNVLKSLKAYESGNVDEAISYFGDSISLRYDEYDSKISHDSLKAIFTKWRTENKTVKVTMSDWESVKSKATNEEYVTIWYTQVNEDLKGKKDSSYIVDDLKIENGKIVELDEKSRKFPKKKM